MLMSTFAPSWTSTMLSSVRLSVSTSHRLVSATRTTGTPGATCSPGRGVQSRDRAKERGTDDGSIHDRASSLERSARLIQPGASNLNLGVGRAIQDAVKRGLSASDVGVRGFILSLGGCDAGLGGPHILRSGTYEQLIELHLGNANLFVHSSDFCAGLVAVRLLGELLLHTAADRVTLRLRAPEQVLGARNPPARETDIGVRRSDHHLVTARGGRRDLTCRRTRCRASSLDSGLGRTDTVFRSAADQLPELRLRMLQHRPQPA